MPDMVPQGPESSASKEVGIDKIGVIAEMGKKLAMLPYLKNSPDHDMSQWGGYQARYTTTEGVEVHASYFPPDKHIRISEVGLEIEENKGVTEQGEPIQDLTEFLATLNYLDDHTYSRGDFRLEDVAGVLMRKKLKEGTRILTEPEFTRISGILEGLDESRLVPPR